VRKLLGALLYSGAASRHGTNPNVLIYRCRLRADERADVPRRRLSRGGHAGRPSRARSKSGGHGQAKRPASAQIGRRRFENEVRGSRGRGGNKLRIGHKGMLVEAGELPAGEVVCSVEKHKGRPGAEIVVIVIKDQARGADAGFDVNGAGDVARENVVLDGDIRGGCG